VDHHPDVVQRLSRIMDQEHTPSPDFVLGSEILESSVSRIDSTGLTE